MKTLLFAISLLISGCSCCGSDVITYYQDIPIVKINERYIPVPEIMIDGAELPIIQEDNLWTFSGEATDSTTGKKVELSGVVDTVAKKILYTVHMKKDSVKVQDSTTTVTLKQVKSEPSWFEKRANEVFYFVIALILLGFVYKFVWSKQ